MLDEAQINQAVETYKLEMARYESTARFVEQRLRRELREAAIPVLLSSRAKHPEDLREKLRRKSNDYAFEALMTNLNQVVTDVAGCRVIVYDPRQREVAAEVVERTLPVRTAHQASKHVHDKDSGYRAIHLLVVLDASADVELSLRDAVCEVQVTSLAAHIFNELEHEIGYKSRGAPPGARVKRTLVDLVHGVRLVDSVVERLQDERAREKRPIEDAEALRFAVERLLDRPVSGEVEKLFRLLRSNVFPLTATNLEGLGLRAAHDRGRSPAAGEAEPPDDVTAMVLGLMAEFPDFPEPFRELASRWKGPTTPLKRAIMDWKKQ